MKYSETESDICNIDAWAKVVGDLLFLVRPEARITVLRRAVQHEEAEIAGREKHGRLKIVFAADLASDGSWMKTWHAAYRLKSLVVQVFARCIINSHSPEGGAKLLFADHLYGTGSGNLGDYIDGLPRKRRAA